MGDEYHRSRLRRQDDLPQTPFERVRACPAADPAKVAALAQIHSTQDPFALAPSTSSSGSSTPSRPIGAAARP